MSRHVDQLKIHYRNLKESFSNKAVSRCFISAHSAYFIYSCGQYTVDQHLDGKSDHAIVLYTAVIKDGIGESRNLALSFLLSVLPTLLLTPGQGRAEYSCTFAPAAPDVRARSPQG